MRLFIELRQEEAEKVFDILKGFKIEEIEESPKMDSAVPLVKDAEGIPAPTVQTTGASVPSITAPAVEPVHTPVVPTTAHEYTIEQLAIAGTQLVDAGKRDDLVKLLNSFNVQALTMLPKERFGEFAIQLRSMGVKI